MVNRRHCWLTEGCELKDNFFGVSFGVQKKEKIFFTRLILVNLMPVFGVAFLGWDAFWIALSYVVETLAIYIVFELDYYFIDRHSRFPFPFALLQFFFTMLPMTGLLTGSVYFIYWITEAGANAETDTIVKGVQRYIEDPDLPWVFAYLFIIELVTFYIRKARIMGYQAKNMWRVIRRILFAQLYLVAALTLLSAFPKNIIAFAIFIIGFKTVLEYSLEDKKFYQKIMGRFFRKRS